MSNNLRIYPSVTVGGGGETEMHVTAFVGTNGNPSVQFTIGGKYCAMRDNQVRDLIATLQKRLRRVKSYQATSNDLNVTVAPQGVTP